VSHVREGRLRAIAVMIAAVAVFSFMDALLKLLSARYPPMQVATLRGATSLPFTLLPVLIAGRLRDLRPRRWPMHLLRGALSVLVIGGFVYAVSVLSLANAYSVFLAAPLIVAALSVPLLRERIDWRNWMAILVGLAGVLVMLRPTRSGLVSFGALAALVGATAYALSGIAVRVLTRTDTTVSVVFWTVGLMTLFAGSIAAPRWVTLQRGDWKWLVAMGLFAAVGQYLLTEAFRSAPPSVVSPFEYTALLWGIGIDRVVWHVLPSAQVCVGGGIVITSGLYLIWHERTRDGHEPTQQSWKWAAEQGRMARRSPTVDDVARQQEEDSP
jgi:drug/metabolite transporter (DMT)-like permease